MSKIVLYPANGYDFDAADVAAYLAGLTSGVFSSAEDFPVTAAGGLKVTVGAGRGWVHPSRFTGYSITKREADTLTMPLADPSLPRIDCIVMRYDAGARAASLQVLQGTASSTPTAPAISRTELIYDLCLAEITRPAGSTNITTGQITDTRLDEALCGIVRDGVTGIPTEELIASARERINALEETASAAAKEADASKTAAAQSEANAEVYKEAAATSERNAAGSASASAGSAAAAARSKSAAEWRATKAADSASAAEKSKTAAATSESNAAKHEEAAKKYSEEAGAKAGTDKTLSIENAPADAKATGDALAGKLGLHDMADNAEKWSGYSIRQEHNTSDTWIPVFSDDNVDYVLKSEIADLNGIATSGSGYTRFTDGTQICWGTAIVNGQVSETNVKVSYPLAFADTPSIVAGSNWNIGNTPVCIGWENSTSFSIGLGQPGTGISRWLAIGRWK